MSTPTIRSIQLKHCDFEAKVDVAGSGPPLVFLHAAAGPDFDDFLKHLAQRYTVYAPHHPGTGATKRESIYEVQTLWDLVLIYDEILDALGLDTVPLIGGSFGGMMGCEIAAHRPERISKLVLLDPIGLWRDDAPVAPYMLMAPEKLQATLFKHLHAPAVQKALAMPTDRNEVATKIADLIWSFGCTGKFVWPIPDKGLKRRLHRITAETLIVWGRDDALVSSIYAEEFRQRIANARVTIIEDCGHVPQIERREELQDIVEGFLRGS